MASLNRSFQIFLWSYAFVYVVFCSLQITQVDLWWQLSEGLHILRTWTLPSAPAVAFGLPATPYFDEYAGYEVVLALLFKIGGFPGIWLAFISIYLATMLLPLAGTRRKYPSFDLVTTGAFFFAAILLRQRLEERPEMVGGFFLVLLMVTLRRSHLEKIPKRTLVILFGLFLAWTNTHSSFVIGFFVLGLWLAHELILKYREFPIRQLVLHGALPIGVVSLVATMLNPYGPGRLLFPFVQAFDPGSTALSPEMWPVTNFTSTAGGLVAIVLGFLVWGLLTTRGVPVWLVVFAIVAAILSIKSFRFVNFLTISLLFVYAERGEAKKSELPVVLGLLKGTALCLLCIFLIFGDAFAILFTYGEMHGERQLATHVERFAPAICSISVDKATGRVPVLCGHGIGSYLSFAGNSRFRPLLDSGLSHFSNDTKRYFFLLWHEPAALSLVLQNLNVNYVILNKETFPWAPTLHRLPQWDLVACDTRGMLWRRSGGGPHPLDAAMRDEVETSMRELGNNGDTVGAFDYSTLLDRPSESLGLMAEYGGPEWSEAFFNSFCAWVDTLPTDTIRDFLGGKRSRQYPLVEAVLSARLGPEAFARFVATKPPGYRPWFWKALEVRECLAQGDRTEARALFDTISPAPVSSVTYYVLWHEVHGADAEIHGSGLSAYGQWQTWDDEARRFVEAMSGKLNDRMAELDRNPEP